MKILNLYAGIGGNRKNWDSVRNDLEITAIENVPEIAKIYQDFFPKDKVIIVDAHQYLLEHFKEFDFIWSSPPCPTHSRFNLLSNVQEGKSVKYPDMTLWQEIIYLKYWCKTKWVVENVISYYEPFLQPVESGSHYFWTNFYLNPLPNEKRGIRGGDQEFRKLKTGLNLDKYNLTKHLKIKILNNCVEPETGLHIFLEANREYKTLL